VLLAPAQPNPARGETRFRFELPEGAGRVSLAIYDLSGRRLRTLIAGALGAGPHEARWDGRGEDGSPAPAGMYFARLEAGPRSAARKLVLAH
jgi:flagellar hook assembly protein FlgD